jgi:hypothetical protein
LGAFGDGDEILGSLEVDAHCGAPRRPGCDHGKERVTDATGNGEGGRGPVHRKLAGPTLKRERRDEAARVVRRWCFDCPVEHSAEVVDVAHDDLGPLEVLSSPEVRASRFGQCHVVFGVAPSRGDQIAGRVEPFPRVLADGFEQPVAHSTIDGVGDDEGLVHQLTQHVDHIMCLAVVAG